MYEESPYIKEMRELREWDTHREEMISQLNMFIDDIPELYYEHWKYVEDRIESHRVKKPYFIPDQIRERIIKRFEEGKRQ